MFVCEWDYCVQVCVPCMHWSMCGCVCTHRHYFIIAQKSNITSSFSFGWPKPRCDVIHLQVGGSVSFFVAVDSRLFLFLSLIQHGAPSQACNACVPLSECVSQSMWVCLNFSETILVGRWPPGRASSLASLAAHITGMLENEHTWAQFLSHRQQREHLVFCKPRYCVSISISNMCAL